MFCPRCGTDNDNDAHFCANCGHRFAPASQPAAPAPPLPPAEPDANATQIISRTPPATEPAPSTAPPSQTAGPPLQPQPEYRPPGRGGFKPAFAAGAVLAGLAAGALVGAAFVLSSGNDSSGSNRSARAEDTPAAAATSAQATSVAIATQSPVRGPGYKLTAIFVEPPNQATPVPYDKRVFDAIVAGVNWDDAAKLYNRRYPLNYIYGSATTNLQLQRYLLDDAKRLLVSAGYPNNGPKFYLASNPSDSVFANWLTGQLRSLGLIVVTDANAFTPEEKQKGYYGLVIDVIPA